MEHNAFAEFYKDALNASYERSGRPDACFFRRLSEYGGINGRYYMKLANTDANTLGKIEGARDIEACNLQHPKAKSHFVRYYSYTAVNLHFMEVFARAFESLRNHQDALDQAETIVAETIAASTREVDESLAQSRQAMVDNGVTQTVRYGTGPLVIPAEIVSPYCATYLFLILKADELFGLLEYQRLRGFKTNADCDKAFAAVDRVLKNVPRCALRLAGGLRHLAFASDARTSAAAESPAVHQRVTGSEPAPDEEERAEQQAHSGAIP